MLDYKVIQASRIWKQNNKYVKPYVLLARYQGKYFVTSTDNKPVNFFVNVHVKNQKYREVVYAAVSSKCKMVFDDKLCVFLYEIKEGALQQVSCTKPFRDVDIFAQTQIANIFDNI